MKDKDATGDCLVGDLIGARYIDYSSQPTKVLILAMGC